MMKKYLWMMTVSCALGLFAAGCGKIDTDGDRDNAYTPISLTTKQSALVSDGNAFSYRFIGQIDAYARYKEQTDWFVSPLSLQMALGMLLNGAQGQTANEICRMLGYGDGETAEINNYFRLLLDQLPKLDQKTDLALANAIFHNKSIELKAPFRDAVNKSYDAQLQALDFSKTKSAAGTINDWCKEQTKGMIPSVLDEVDPNALAYLVNALYFKSQWRDKFPKGNTASEKFTREDGSTVKVKMMKLAGSTFNYGENDVYQAVQLPYGNGAYAMTVLLPNKGQTTGDIAARLAKDGGIAFDAENPSVKAIVDLWLPRFETKYHILLNDVLQYMGMNRAFDPFLADFLAMSDRQSHVDFVQQDAAIKVDEDGSEAAAVTVIGVKFNAIGATREVVFHADHPFIYLITEYSTGVVLFAGQYAAGL